MEPLPIVCMSIGEAVNPVYVERLASMLRRHMPVPYELHCIVDRPQPLPQGVHTIDATAWPGLRAGMRPTVQKLRLFDAGRLPFERLLYLDTSLVIGTSLGPLVDHLLERKEELVLLKDWNYDVYNTCVMAIRPGGALAAVVKAYDAGVVYPHKIAGDQDFLTAFIRDRRLEDHVALWPEGMVASYKAARWLNRRDPKGAYEVLERAAIVKFHGEPKMDQLLDPWYRITKVWLHKMRLRSGTQNARFWISELKRHWR